MALTLRNDLTGLVSREVDAANNRANIVQGQRDFNDVHQAKLDNIYQNILDSIEDSNQYIFDSVVNHTDYDLSM